MARLMWGGCESGHPLTDGFTAQAGTAVVADGSIARSGLYSYKTSGAQSGLRHDFTGVDGRRYYLRTWLRVDSYPVVTGGNRQALIRWTQGASPMGCTLEMASDGRLWAVLTAVPSFTYTTPDPIPVNTWFCIETSFRGLQGTSPDGLKEMVLKINNVEVANAVTPVTLAQIVNRVEIGTIVSTGITTPPTVWIDDVALNDDTGTRQNSFPGYGGKIVNLVPISDGTIGADWKNNTNAAFSPGAYDCLDNRPPQPAAFGTASTGQQQIRDSVATATSPAADLSVNLQTYTTAGVGSGDDVTVLQHTAILGDSAGAVAFTMGVQVLSNPAESSETSYTTPVGAATATITASSWLCARGPQTYSPTVVKGTSPVLMIGKRSVSGTNAAGACYAAVQIEYAPASNQKFMAVT
jgi:hypothetical protein